MVDYKLSIEDLTGPEKQSILNALEDTKQFQVNRASVLFLMNEMNRMYSREIYTSESLSCSDCVNKIINFWKITVKEWSV